MLRESESRIFSALFLFVIVLGSSVGTEIEPTGNRTLLCPQTCNLQNGFCEPDGSCRCYKGWKGESCDQCIRAVGCRQGSCQEPEQCVCHRGYGGRHCQLDLKYCERHLPCQNGGTCINDGKGSYSCRCPYGYAGRTCALRHSPIVSPPMIASKPRKSCLNGGSCSGNACKTCSCPKGYAGSRCQTKVHLCVTRPCANGAQCRDLVGRYKCECTRGFYGKHCDIDMDECAIFGDDACENGGRCVNLRGSYKCQCPGQYEGARCKKLVKRIKAPSYTTTAAINLKSPIKEVGSSSLQALLHGGSSRSSKDVIDSTRRRTTNTKTSTNIKVTHIVQHVEVKSIDSDDLLDEKHAPSMDDQPSVSVVQAVTFAFLGVAVVLFVVIGVFVWLYHSKKRKGGSTCCPCYEERMIKSTENNKNSKLVGNEAIGSTPSKSLDPHLPEQRSAICSLLSINDSTSLPDAREGLYVALPRNSDAMTCDPTMRNSFLVSSEANYLLNDSRSGISLKRDSYYN